MAKFSAFDARRIFGPQPQIQIDYTYIPSTQERLARNVRGEFTSAQVEVEAEMEVLAVKLQEMQVAALHTIQDEHEMRDQRGTHYLEDAILSPQNRIVTRDGFRVGIEAAFQESPAAPYWRGLETGTSVHVGQRMWGLWITHNGFSGPVEEGRDAIGFKSWPGIPEDQWDAFVRPYKDRRTGEERMPKARGAKLKRLPAFTIKNPIPEYAYLRTGIRNFVESGAIAEGIQRAVKRASRVQLMAIERGISTTQARSMIND